MSELSRVEDLLKTGVEEPVLPMSRLEAILRGEKITPQSRVEELLLQYNPSDILIEKRITENGTYFAVNDNADGYFKVVVDTPVVPPTVLDHLVETITTNGLHEYTPTHDGFDTAAITVAVPIPPEKILGTKTITENDTYDASDDSTEVTVTLDNPSIPDNSFIHVDILDIADVTKIVGKVRYTMTSVDRAFTVDISNIPTYTPSGSNPYQNMYRFDSYNAHDSLYISKDATGIFLYNMNEGWVRPVIYEFGYKETKQLDGYSQVTVAVPIPAPVLDDITITENGVYTSEHDGFDEVTVNVESHDTTPKAIISDKFSILATAKSAARDYYANHILIGSSSQTYIMTPLDKSLINATYAYVMYDGSSTFNGFFTYSGSDVTFSINGEYDMKITGTSAGLTWWRGSWRDIYMDIYRLKEA